jgi:energy-coupling factor transport system ATP-binding protein
LSVRDARRLAGPLRTRLADRTPPPITDRGGEVVVAVKGLGVRYGLRVALRCVDLDVHAGEVVAVMGRNGAGKSTLLQALVGARPPDAGDVRVTGRQPHTLAGAELLRHVGLVPQDAGDLLWAETVGQECQAADQDARAADGTTRALLTRLAPGVHDDTHPRDLSEGQRLALALAVVLAATPPVLLLDEPTRGLDYPTKARLVGLLRALAADGKAVVLATHDVELVAELATRVVVLADGDVVADGPTADVVTASPAYAPQVAKILAPLPWLTIRQVTNALQEAG